MPVQAVISISFATQARALEDHGVPAGSFAPLWAVAEAREVQGTAPEPSGLRHSPLLITAGESRLQPKGSQTSQPDHAFCYSRKDQGMINILPDIAKSLSARGPGDCAVGQSMHLTWAHFILRTCDACS